MKNELEKKLFKKFPKIFKHTKGKPDPMLPMAFGCECGDGWYPMLNKLCELLQYETDENGAPQTVAAQVKEKFGGLRFYIDGGNDRIHDIISTFESISYIICEECGTTDTAQMRSKQGWMFTSCDKCWMKRC